MASAVTVPLNGPAPSNGASVVEERRVLDRRTANVSARCGRQGFRVLFEGASWVKIRAVEASFAVIPALREVASAKPEAIETHSRLRSQDEPLLVGSGV